MKYNFNLIDLNGPQGNAYALMGLVRQWLIFEGAQQDVIDEFLEEAKSSDYNHLLNVCKQYTALANNLAYENGFADEHDCIID